MRWTGLCLLVCLACGEEQKEESKPETLPTAQPPRIESLAALAPADTVGYVEIGPLGTLEDLIDPELLWAPGPFLRAARDAADPARPHALAFQRKGRPITLLWLRQGARLQREQAEDELLDIREFGRRALIHHIDEQYVAPASPIEFTRKLPAGAIRGRVQLDGLRKFGEFSPMAAVLLAQLEQVDSVAFGLGVRDERIFLQGESILQRPAALAPSSLPALLGALPDDMPFVLAADVEIGKLVALLAPFANEPIAAHLEAASILGRGYALAVRPSVQGTEFIQLYGEADMGAYFARLRKLIDQEVAGKGLKIEEPAEGVIEISSDAAQQAGRRDLAFSGAENPARMARLLGDRLVRNGYANLGTRVEGKLVVTERPRSESDVARLKKLACKPFGFELHRTAHASPFAHYRDLFVRTRNQHVPPRDRSAQDKTAKRNVHGLRWYPVSAQYEGVQFSNLNGWVLCALDDARITGHDVVDAWHANDPDWPRNFLVKIEFKKDALQRLTELTSARGRLAFILNGAVVQAPELVEPLPRVTQISYLFTRRRAIELAGEIRSPGARLRFVKEVPRGGTGRSAIARALLPDGRMRIRVAQAGRRGVLAINTSDERVEMIVAKLKRKKLGGDLRIELRADLKQFLEFFEEYRGVVADAKAVPTLTLRVTGGATNFQFDASLDEQFVRRIRNHARQRELDAQLDRLVETFPVDRTAAAPDPWGRPLHFEELEDGRTRIRSSGPDGKRGTDDDVTRAVGPPRLDGRAWFREYVAWIRAGKLDELWAMHKGHESEALHQANRYAREQIDDADDYRELRRLAGREPHGLMADRAFWNRLRHRDARWLKDGTLKLEFADEERVDDRQHVRIRYTRGDFSFETVAVLVHVGGAVRIHTPPDWLAGD
ncbi:MAG: SecDF P1 head subdomain-containing protein [Planctomycetota bacterium]